MLDKQRLGVEDKAVERAPIEEPAIPACVCEFCHRPHVEDGSPAEWELVWQSWVCPECQARVRADGGYAVVKGGAYATIPDPRG